jgi:hypothetical protein
MNKRKVIKYLLITFGVLIILTGIALWLNSLRSSYNLNINVTPKEASIKINDIEEGKGAVNKFFPKGIYKITTELENYIPDEREANLTSDRKISITLIKKLGLSAPPDKFRFKSTQSLSIFSPNIINDTDVTGYDKGLKMIFTANENTFTKIYTGDLTFYSFSDLYILFGDKKVKDKIFIYSTKDNKTTTVNTSEVSPVIYASYLSAYDVLFLLGRYDPNTRSSNVYASKVLEPGFQLITTTTANAVEAIRDSLVILFEKLDGNDASIVNILDLKSFKIVLSVTGNKYLISPSKKTLAVISSSKINLIDLTTFSKREIDYSKTDKMLWNDEVSFVLIHNKKPGVTYSYLETEFGQETQEVSIDELNTKTVKEIIGKSQKYIYLRDTEGAIWKISIN